jgi:hypothetical protein
MQINDFFAGSDEGILIVPAPDFAKSREDPLLKRTKIAYSTVPQGSVIDTALHAAIDGHEYSVVSKSENLCLEVLDQHDYDGNGSSDALVSNISACGGSGSANSFFFVSYLGDGHFERSDEFGYSWVNPVVEQWNGRWTVLVESNNSGANLHAPEEVRERYALADGKAVLLERSGRSEIVAEIDVRSDVFASGDPDRTEKLEVDLDSDGVSDVVSFRYWERWGSFLWSVNLSRGSSYESNTGRKRLGVLQTSTKGVRDLVADHDTVLRWNGTRYDGKDE